MCHLCRGLGLIFKWTNSSIVQFLDEHFIANQECSQNEKGKTDVLLMAYTDSAVVISLGWQF